MMKIYKDFDGRKFAHVAVTPRVAVYAGKPIAIEFYVEYSSGDGQWIVLTKGGLTRDKETFNAIALPKYVKKAIISILGQIQAHEWTQFLPDMKTEPANNERLSWFQLEQMIPVFQHALKG